MHIAMVLTGGIVQLAVFVLFGWLWGNSAAAMHSQPRCLFRSGWSSQQ